MSRLQSRRHSVPGRMEKTSGRYGLFCRKDQPPSPHVTALASPLLGERSEGDRSPAPGPGPALATPFLARLCALALLKRTGCL